jgi:chemotaxis protein MotB
MVSYMDIVTLLLTFFVLLFVYTRTTAPDAAAATSTRVSPPQAEAQREHDKGRHARAQPTAPPTADLVSLVETPLLGPTIRFGDAAVTNPTVTVVVEAESVGSPSPESEVAVEDRGHEQPATPIEPAESPVRRPDPTRGASVVAMDAPTGGTAGEPADAAAADSTPVAPERSAPTGDVAGEPTANDVPAAPPSEAAPKPEQALLAVIQASDLGRRVEVSVRKDAVNLEISDEILFDRGSAAVKPAGEQLLAELATLLAQQAVRISVEGHTDDSPIRTARFASNWELSAARATNVTRTLISHAVDPARVRAVGYADTRPRADNGSEPGRARNRRVALVLHIPAGTEPAW